MRQQEAVQTQFARMVGSSPLGAMSELTRQNLELWTKMQETLLATFAPPREPPRDPSKTNNPDSSDTDKS